MSAANRPPEPGRRLGLKLGAGAALSLLSLRVVSAAVSKADDPFAAAVVALTGGAPAAVGKLSLEIAELVENGNAVPISITVDSPLSSAGRVRRIALFAQRNPRPEVAVFEFGPAAGRARVDTRIRLATSQQLLALAELGDPAGAPLLAPLVRDGRQVEVDDEAEGLLVTVGELAHEARELLGEVETKQTGGKPRR